MTEHDQTRTARPSLGRAIIFLVVMAVIAFGLFLFAMAQRSPDGPLIITAAPDPISVSTQSVEIKTAFDMREQFSGLANPKRTSQLGFQTGGRIQSIFADVGDRVKTGATLARLDTRALGAQLASAEAVIEEARAGHALALNTVERQRNLQARGHVSQQAVDEAEAQAATAFARVEAAKAQADTLRVQIDLARITAPYDGVVTQRFADEGAIAGPGSPLLELVESGALEARIGLPAALAATLEEGQTYELVSDTGPVEAELRATTGVIGAGQRTVTTVFEIEDPGTTPAGAVVRLSLDRAIEERGTWAPISALAEATRGLWSVYVAEPDRGGFIAERRLVEIIHSENNRAFVRGVLEPGDRIIIDGLQRITPGQRVDPVDSNAATAARADRG